MKTPQIYGTVQRDVKPPKTFEELELQAIGILGRWGLLEQGGANLQLLKAFEELGETAKAELNGDDDGIKDGVGDAIVVLIGYTYKKGTSITECLQLALNEIKDRTGKLQNGVFIKD